MLRLNMRAHFAEFVVSEIWQFEGEVALFDSFSAYAGERAAR
jgi:hypothetical protein